MFLVATGSSNIVTGETKSFFSFAKSVSNQFNYILLGHQLNLLEQCQLDVHLPYLASYDSKSILLNSETLDPY